MGGSGGERMIRRFLPGPVFGLECLTGPRRWQLYLGRSSFVAGLLAGLWLIWSPQDRIITSHAEISSLGTAFFQLLVGFQIVVVMLAAPAATAGSICVDKGRGTLHHVFVTDLSDREIILGKFFGRMLTIASL